MGYRIGTLLLGLLIALPTGCERAESSTVRAEFGVLFGGDIQDRTTFPLELAAERQELALRVTFPEPLAEDALVTWELERPTGQRGPDGGVAYAAELGERRARPGERRVDAKLRFRRGDPLGTWRIRVRVNGRLVLEREFRVIQPER